MARKQKPIFLNHKFLNDDLAVHLFINTRTKPYNKLHTHTFYDFSFVRDGSIGNRCYGDSVIMSKNDFFIARPECEHQLFLDGKNDYLLYNIEVTENLINKLCALIGIDNFNQIISKPFTLFRFSETDAASVLKLITLAQHNY